MRNIVYFCRSFFTIQITWEMKIELRTYLFTLLLLVASMSAKADDITKEPVGLTLDSTVVEADCQTFGRRLDDIVITPSQDYMLLKFRDLTKDGKWIKFKGDIGAYSLKESKLLWTQPFDFSNSTVYCTKGGILTVKNNNKVTMLNPHTGEVIWQSKFYPAQVDDSTHIVLGYAGRLSGKLSAYDITSGQKLWTVNIPHVKNWGWNHVIREDSVHWLVVADDLNRLNILTGEVSSYDAKTGVTDVKASLLQGLAMVGGAVAGAMVSGGTYVPYFSYYPSGMTDSNVINHLYSNVLRDDSLYYFADRQHVVCLDSMMNTVWSYDLPSKTSAFSQIVSNDSTLYMFNLGFGMQDGVRRKKMGRPFIASFDKRTGACRFMNMLSMKKDMVEDAMLTPDGAFMLFDDALAYKRELNDSAVTISPWQVEEYGKLSGIITQPVYADYKYHGMFELIASDGIFFPVITEKGDILMVDKELRTAEHFPASSLYWPLCMVGDRMCISSYAGGQQNVWLVTMQGVPELKLTIPVHRVGIAGNKLYLHNNRALYSIPLN